VIGLTASLCLVAIVYLVVALIRLTA